MTIPASFIVKINPAVLAAGGNPLVLNGLFLTQNTQMPTNKVLSFPGPNIVNSVAAYFGPGSAEAAAAAIYQAGYVNSTLVPGAMLFAAFNLAARAAFLQGGSLLGMTLTQLQAIAAGILTVSVGGTPITSASISLSAASSFSDAATLIEAGFTTPGFTVTWNAVNACFVFTNTATGSASTISFATTDAFATALALTSATGAILSQGAVADTATTAITNAARLNQNWATLVTLWEPAIGDKTLFGQWISEQDDEYEYAAWDSDAQASTQGSTTSFGAVVKADNLGGIFLISGDPALAAATGTTLGALALNLAIAYAGAVASINFNTPNGRRNLAFLSFASVAPTCADETVASNLLANGYNYYGPVATGNQTFTFLYNGQISGPFLSAVRYVNQIWLNSQFQLALLTLATNVGSLSYNPAGYGMVRGALMDPINAALAFGAIRTGVQLSQAQIQEVNQQAGLPVAPQIQTQGFYLQILDPGAEARALGQTPIINFWYTDGGDILQLTMASTDIL